MTNEQWFATRELAAGVYLVAEPFHVNSYIVEGTEARVHIDTGLGVADIRAVGDRCSPLPPFAANTHHHFDHVGGNELFDEIAIHELGVDLLAAGPDSRWLDDYRAWARKMVMAWPTFREMDEAFFGMLVDVSTLRPWPEGFDLDAWRVAGSQATRPLHEGDVLDLGRRRLLVLHTPGHTQDSVCFLDEDRGILFTGDTVNSGPILVNDPDDSNLEDFARSVRRLADEAAPSVSVVYMSHGVSFGAEPAYLREVADGFEAVVEGSVPLEPVHDEASGPSRIARFARFAIVLPGNNQ